MKKERILNAVGKISDDLIEDAAVVAKKESSAVIRRRWVALAACLCLVMIGAFAAPALKGDHGGVTPQPGINHETNDALQENDNNTTQPANLLVVNEVDNITIADMDVQFSHYGSLSETENEVVLKQFETAMGLRYNAFTAKIPDTYVIKSFYSVDVPSDAARTEYVPHDYVFEYQTEDGGSARIAMCSAEKPLRDLFIMSDNPKLSEINGVSVAIYGYQGTFMVQFSHENINYDMETSNIKLEELEELIDCMVA